MITSRIRLDNVLSKYYNTLHHLAIKYNERSLLIHSSVRWKSGYSCLTCCYSYLEQCHKTWEVLQKLQGRANYPECSHKFIDTVAPAIHRYAVHLHKLALKQQERDGQSFIIRRWVSETRSILEEFQVPINKLNLVEVKGGINLVLRHPCQLSSVENSSQEVLYDRTSSSRPTKRVKFDTVSVEVLPRTGT